MHPDPDRCTGTRRRRSTPSARAGKTAGSHADLYDHVTQRIVSELEAGRLPWVQPWGDGAGTPGPGLPRNALTGRSYSGINILILWARSSSMAIRPKAG